MEQRSDTNIQPVTAVGAGLDPAFVPGLVNLRAPEAEENGAGAQKPPAQRTGRTEPSESGDAPDRTAAEAEAAGPASAEPEEIGDPAEPANTGSAEGPGESEGLEDSGRSEGTEGSADRTGSVDSPDSAKSAKPKKSAKSEKSSKAAKATEAAEPAGDSADSAAPSDPDGAAEEATGTDAPSDGPSLEASDRRASITADAGGVRFTLDDQEADFRWDEIGAVEVAVPRFGKRLTVVVHTHPGRSYETDAEAPSRTVLKEWNTQLDAVLDAYFDDGQDEDRKDEDGKAEGSRDEGKDGTSGGSGSGSTED